MRRPASRRPRFWPVALLATGTLVACASDLDTTRAAPIAKTTLGEEIYTALCDRVGASSLPEDLSGLSYRAVCHKGSRGWSSAGVQPALLPPASGALAEPRRLSVAKIEAMGSRRADLVAAFDALLPDVSIPDPVAPDDTSRQVRLHDALGEMLRRLTPLYDGNPYATADRPEPPLLPTTTRSLGALMAALADSDEAHQALSRISGREGYRPADRGLGAVRTLLAYPRLRRLTSVLLDRTGPGGPLEGRLQQFLRVAEQELRTFTPDPAAGPFTVDDARLQPSRPRSKVELLSTLLLGEADEYVRGQESRLLAARDLRGFAIPLGLNSGSSLFVDADGDGAADVDPLGRFVSVDGTLLLAPPFANASSPLSAGITFDSLGRAQQQDQLLFRYVDTSRTFLHAVLDDLRPLSAPTAGGSPLMKAIEGTLILAGPRRTSSRDYTRDKVTVTVPYAAFDDDSSPLVDMVHATGQILGAPEGDDYLGSILALHEQRPATTARTLQLAWSLRNKSKDPAYAQAILADSSTFWEDMVAWLARVARVGPELHTGPSGGSPRGLLGDLSVALASPAAVTYLPAAFGPPMQYRDRVSYNPAAINGPPLDLTSNVPLSPGASPFSAKVDRTLPDSGDNRSAFQRFAHIIAAANHVNTCNRPKALVKSNLELCGISIPLTYPLDFNPFDAQKSIPACHLLDIHDLGVFFVDSALPWDHPRRAHLTIQDDTLLGLLKEVDKFVPSLCGDLDIDSVLQASTGLSGLTTTPTPQALMRLVFFGANVQGDGLKPPASALDPLLTSTSKNLDTFVSNALDLVGTQACPQNADGVNVCTDYAATLRGVEPGTFFVAETPYLASHPPGCLAHCAAQSGKSKQFCESECQGPSSGFFEGLRPVLTAFAGYSYLASPGDTCTTDLQGRCVGEQLFLDLMGILDRHWSSQGSSLYRYEDFLAWALSPDSDLFGTLSELIPAMDTLPYTSPRVQPGQPRTPLAVTTSMVSYLFDPAFAASYGITDRQGTAQVHGNDGTLHPQVTPYELMVQALRGFDHRFDQNPAALARWRESRSALVDQFLLASSQTWTNPAVARALPSLGRVLREQTNAHCPGRETSHQCDWARRDLARSFATVLGGPLFAALGDLTDGLRADDELRDELERLLTYLLAATADPDELALLLTTVGDLLQVLDDDITLAPPLRALSSAAAPSAQVKTPTSPPGPLFDPTLSLQPSLTPTDHPGTLATSLTFLRALLAEPADHPEKSLDRYHALDRVLPLLVTPVQPGQRAPLEVILDALNAVQRLDSSTPGAFAPADFRALAGGLKSFLLDDHRGMEQLYTIVHGRDGAPSP